MVDGKPLTRPRTILIDSAELESSEGMKADFKQAAGAEIAAFKAEYRRRSGADVEKITDDELLREVMNTVNTVPRWVEMRGVVGAGERERGDDRHYRPQEVAFTLAKRILDTQFNTVDDKRPWLFPRLVRICQEWIEQRVTLADNFRSSKGIVELARSVAERIPAQERLDKAMVSAENQPWDRGDLLALTFDDADAEAS